MELGNRTSASVYTLRRRSGDRAADLSIQYSIY